MNLSIPGYKQPIGSCSIRFGAHTVVIGTQLGDEAKGKITAVLSEDADIVARFNGGANAGHTVVRERETYKFRLLPSGILRDKTICVIGSGTVINPEILQKEIKGLQSRGVSVRNLIISPRAHLTLPYHLLEDNGGHSTILGTTRQGVGPTYRDKIFRIGLRVGDLFDNEALPAHLDRLSQTYNVSKADLMKICQDYRTILAPYVQDTVEILEKALTEKKNILLEGSQSTHLDIDHGTYPYVTSSNAVAGAAATGIGIGPNRIDRVVGVTKAFTTRLGAGPFPTELDITNDPVGHHLSSIGKEVGVFSGEPRRCGWFDAVMVRYSARINGLTELALTKLDTLDGLDEISLCVGYRDTRTGKIITSFPAIPVHNFQYLAPVYETMPGWKGSVRGCRTVEQLPKNALNYLQRISELVDVPITIISVGPDRKETIILDNPILAPHRPMPTILNRL